MSLDSAAPYLWGIGVLVFLYIFFYGIWGKSWNPVDLVMGQDNRPSTSKFQFFLWTLVVLFSYVALYAARACHGFYWVIDEIPQNLLIAMGLSIATATAAKGITVGYLETGRITKTDPTATTGPTPKSRIVGLRSILVDDEGYPDLSKIQMISWTFVAIGIYLILLSSLVNHVSNAFEGAPALVTGEKATWENVTPKYLDDNPVVAKKMSLPDISGALMVLMGLSQGAYIGKKLVTMNTPRLSQLTPSSGKPGTDVTISGVSLSEGAASNLVTLNGKTLPVPASIVTAASQIKFTFPQKQPDGSAWNPGDVVQVGVLVDGQDSGNTLPFTVTVPALNQISANSDATGAKTIVLSGAAFGGTQGASKVLIDGVPFAAAIPAGNWSDTSIKLTIPPATYTAGPHQVSVTVDGQLQTGPLTFMIP